MLYICLIAINYFHKFLPLLPSISINKHDKDISIHNTCTCVQFYLFLKFFFMISERVIAMSFPSKGMMAMYRNNVHVSTDDKSILFPIAFLIYVCVNECIMLY
jgi:hypothetical protein